MSRLLGTCGAWPSSRSEDVGMREISDILEMVRSMGFSNGESYLLLSVRFSLPKDCLREKCDCRAEAART